MSPQETVKENKETINGKKSTTSQPLNESEIQVDGNVYNAKALADIHPGGPLFIKAFAGRDSTEAFLSYHRRQFPHDNDKVKASLKGIREPSKPAGSDADYLELCAIVEQALPRAKSFAHWTYFIKAAFILVGSVGLEIYMHSTKSYFWYYSAIMGWFMAVSFLYVFLFYICPIRRKFLIHFLTNN